MLSVTEQLLHSTIRIECVNADGRSSSGTGFFFNFPVDDERYYPILATNKHVVQGQAEVFFHLTLAKNDGQPDYGNHQRIRLADSANRWIGHPDAEVDLAVSPVGWLFNSLDEKGKRPFIKSISEDLIPGPEQLAELHAVEDILMIATPTGFGMLRTTYRSYDVGLQQLQHLYCMEERMSF